MSLYERLIGTREPKLPVHQFCAALAEQARGRLTSAQVKAMFALSKTGEEAEYDELFAKMSLVSSKELEDVLELAEYGLFYTDPSTMKSRFGVTAALKIE